MDYRLPYDIQSRGTPYNTSVQEAAIVATAAASGQSYLYLPSEPSLRASPRIGGNSGIAVKKERETRSPQQIGFPTTQTQHLQHQQSELDARAQEEPQFVNAKQFHRILKRRAARKLQGEFRPTFHQSSQGRQYIYKSRHKHAMRRPRGPGGRFLTTEEVEQMERSKGEGGEADGDLDATGADSGTSKKVIPTKRGRSRVQRIDK